MSKLKFQTLVFARNDSKRLKEKHLKKIGDFTVLEHIFNRLLYVKNIESPILATTNRTIDDKLVSHAKKIGFLIYRGRYSDVLGRFYDASKIYGADYFLKINGDCPFISYELCNKIINQVKLKGSKFITAKGKFIDLPIGLGPEIISINALNELNKKTPFKFRESISGFIFEKNDLSFKFDYLKIEKKDKFYGPNFTLDTASDLKYLNKFWTISGNTKFSSFNLNLIKNTILKMKG